MKGKAEAILLLSRNVDLEVVAELAERTTTTIKTRLRDWHQDPTRIDTHRPRRQPQRIQTHPQQSTEITTVLQQPPGAQGLPTELWTAPDLANWLDSHFHMVYASETSNHFLPPHLARLSFHTPRAVDQHRAPETEITARMNQIHHELATSWNDPDVMIMTADEVRIEHEATLRRAWHPTGTTTKLRVNRIKQAQSHHRVPPRTRRHRRPDRPRLAKHQQHHQCPDRTHPEIPR